MFRSKRYLPSLVFSILSLLVSNAFAANSSSSNFFPSVKSAHLIGPANLNPQEITELDETGVVFFRGTVGTSDTGLWKSDGTEAGTVLLFESIAGMPAKFGPGQLASLKGKIYFLYDGDVWQSDGTKAGTKSFYTCDIECKELVKSGEFLYFTHRNKVLMTDGETMSEALCSGTNPCGLTPDGANGVYFTRVNSTDDKHRLIPTHIKAESITNHAPYNVNPDGTYKEMACNPQDGVEFLAVNKQKAFFTCNVENPLYPSKFWVSGSGNRKMPNELLEHPAEIKFQAAWNGQGYDYKKHTFVAAGEHFYAFDKPSAELVSYRDLEFFQFRLDMSQATIKLAQPQLKDACGAAYPVAERLINGERYFLSRPNNCSSLYLPGGIYKLDATTGRATYITDIETFNPAIDTTNGDFRKYRAYFNALFNGGRISAVETHAPNRKIFYNNAGSLEVTLLGNDECPNSITKTEPGICGCNIDDTDDDNDGVVACMDACPNDVYKTEPGVCGCGTLDGDFDMDGITDCLEPISTATAAAGTIVGRILQSDATLAANVFVQIKDLGTTLTNEKGEYQFNGATADKTYEVSFYRMGYTFNTPSLLITTGSDGSAIAPDVVVTQNSINTKLMCDSTDYGLMVNDILDSTQKLTRLANRAVQTVAAAKKASVSLKNKMAKLNKEVLRVANNNFTLSKELTLVAYRCNGKECTSRDHSKTLSEIRKNGARLLKSNSKMAAAWKTGLPSNAKKANSLESASKSEYKRFLGRVNTYPKKIEYCE